MLAHPRQEAFDVLDALGHPQVRPQALAVVVGPHRGVERGERGVGVEQRGAAEDHLALAVGLGEEYRAAYRRQRAVPMSQLAVDQVVALLDGASGRYCSGMASRLGNSESRWSGAVMAGPRMTWMKGVGLL